jgi:hypothetical protein
LTKGQARRYTEIIERSYLSTHKHFQNKPPGGAYVTDESAGSSLHMPRKEREDINPFGAVTSTRGFLQYLPLIPGRPEAIRAIMVPDQDGCELEMLGMPELEDST